MRKKVYALFLVFIMLLTLFSGCGKSTSDDVENQENSKQEESIKDDKNQSREEDEEKKDFFDGSFGSLGEDDFSDDETEYNEDKEIRVMAFTDEVPNMVDMYLKMHPELDYVVKETIVSTANQSYQPALDEMLKGDYGPDIYALESEFVLKYTQGDAAGYAATYDELGIETTKAITDAKIATYASEIGTRPSDGNIVALPYQSTGGCFIYRRSIAKATWGTDEPAIVQQKIGGGSESWEQFFVAAEELKARGYGIISGSGDIWNAIENSADTGWIVDGKLNIDPKREAFLDISKKLTDNNYHNGTQEWLDDWFADMRGEGPKEVLGFFGPAWLVTFILAENCGGEAIGEGTYGDWAVCNSPIGFCSGGTYVASARSAVNRMSKEKKEVIADIIKWITLDYDEDSLQYMWANGTFYGEGSAKDTVASGVVMEKANGELAFLGGQNMFEYFIPAGDYATGKNMTQYDEIISFCWKEAVQAYVEGKVDRDGAIAQFRVAVRNRVGLE